MRKAPGAGTHYSCTFLLLGFIALFFANGRWAIPAAAFLAPIFLVRFLRLNKPLKGCIFLVFSLFISNIFIWKGYIPTPGIFYYIMALMMSLSTALVYTLERVYSHHFKGIISTLILPSAFVLMDYVSVSANPGGAFGALSTTQTSLPFLQLISITGIWGITFIIYWTASIINWLLDNDVKQHAVRKALWVYAVPVVGILLYGQIRLAHTASDKTVKIASVNIPQQYIPHIFSDQPDSVNQAINDMFLKNCEIAASSEAKIIFGNEIMLNMTSDQEDAYVERAEIIAEKNNIYIGLPLLIYPSDDQRTGPMNKITWISPQKEILFTFFKAKPTPGEGSYGDGIIKYADTPYGRISSVICFDMDFPGLIQQASRMDIDIMLVPGNDWQEITPYHTYAASLRAIEQGFNMVRSASRGLSASFNGKGQVLSYQNYFTTDDALFYADVPIKGSRTVYAVIGDLFAWICILFFIGTGFLVFKRKKASHKT